MNFSSPDDTVGQTVIDVSDNMNMKTDTNLELISPEVTIQVIDVTADVAVPEVTTMTITEIHDERANSA